MSAEALGWAFANSPFSGTELVIHLAVADVANDVYDYRLWMKQEALAEKSHCSRGMVCRTLRKMVDLGLLAEADDGANAVKSKHQARCFRFLMPESDVTRTRIDPESDVTREHIRCNENAHRDVTRTRIVGTQGGTQEELKGFADAPPEPRRSTTAPDSFVVTAALRQWGEDQAPLADLDAETEQFLDYHRAKGTRFKDWESGWRTWIRNAQKYALRDGRSKPAVTDPGAMYSYEVR